MGKVTRKRQTARGLAQGPYRLSAIPGCRRRYPRLRGRLQRSGRSRFARCAAAWPPQPQSRVMPRGLSDPDASRGGNTPIAAVGGSHLHFGLITLDPPLGGGGKSHRPSLLSTSGLGPEPIGRSPPPG